MKNLLNSVRQMLYNKKDIFGQFVNKNLLFVVLMILYIFHLRHVNKTLERDLTFYEKNSDGLVQVIDNLSNIIKMQDRTINDMKKREKDILEDKNQFFYEKLKIYIRLASYIENFNSKNKMMIAYYIMYYSDKYKVPINIITSVIYHESRFIPTAISPKQCIGLMQVNYKVWFDKLNKENIISKISDLYKIKNNIEAGTYILRYYYELTGSWEEALYRYFGISPYGKHIYKKRVISKAKEIKLIIE